MEASGTTGGGAMNRRRAFCSCSVRSCLVRVRPRFFATDFRTAFRPFFLRTILPLHGGKLTALTTPPDSGTPDIGCLHQQPLRDSLSG